MMALRLHRASPVSRTVSPPHAAAEAEAAPPQSRRGQVRYPLHVSLSYAYAHGGKLLRGRGITVNLSSGGVLFESADPLPAGRSVRLRIAWPATTTGSKKLGLRVLGRTVRMQERCTAVQFLCYEFSGRRSN